MVRGGSVYIMTNKPYGVLYVGVTSKLILRVQQHKTKFHPKSFTARYNLDKLIGYEHLPTIVEAIAREKQLKAGNRARKIKFIEAMNPQWLDLCDKLVQEAEGQ
ncbi:MAG: GIY-YIG nuclease family protein [Flavobacteriales bacterium]|nr:GIY-YIG nuclease family protein [Flavobacteriales bacterium]